MPQIIITTRAGFPMAVSSTTLVNTPPTTPEMMPVKANSGRGGSFSRSWRDRLAVLRGFEDTGGHQDD